MELFATTLFGLEKLACSEVEELTNKKPYPRVGKVFLEGDIDSIYCLNLKSRILNKIFIKLAQQEFENLDEIYSIARRLDYTEYIKPQMSFAVTTERVGGHDFTSIDVSRVVGQAVIDSYRHSKGIRLKVDLDDPDINIYCLVRDKEFLIGLNTTGYSLHKRSYRVYNHPAALKPNIASAMINIVNWKPEKTFVDPMCGGGTIPIEACLKALNIPPNLDRETFNFLKLDFFEPSEFNELKAKFSSQIKDLKTDIYGIEKFPHYFKGGLRNLEEAKLVNYVKLILGDGTNVKFYPKDTEFIVVNPPYGLRLKPKEKIENLYDRFLKCVKKIGLGIKLCVITASKRKFKEATYRNDIEIIDELIVYHGTLLSTIFNCIVD
ncbi:MAG: tRNA (guanine(6)-N2)-methyltransferase [Candidatus Odinarchaeia archaeon]